MNMFRATSGWSTYCVRGVCFQCKILFPIHRLFLHVNQLREVTLTTGGGTAKSAGGGGITEFCVLYWSIPYIFKIENFRGFAPSVKGIRGIYHASTALFTKAAYVMFVVAWFTWRINPFICSKFLFFEQKAVNLCTTVSIWCNWFNRILDPWMVLAFSDWLLVSTSNMALSVGEFLSLVFLFVTFLACLVPAMQERFEPHGIKVSDTFDVKPGGTERTYEDSWVGTCKHFIHIHSVNKVNTWLTLINFIVQGSSAD